MKIIAVAFVLTGFLTITLASPLRYRESEEREALLQTLLRDIEMAGELGLVCNNYYLLTFAHFVRYNAMKVVQF